MDHLLVLVLLQVLVLVLWSSASEPPTIVPELTCATGNGGMYRGRIAVTESGKTCQSWSAQTPHQHDKTPENYPHKGLDNNYCRNPDNWTMPWCYTTDPETRWEHCKVPNCDTEDCMHCNGEDYRGSISITENGFICQRWDSQEPHNHDTLRTYPDKNLVENFCRNPRGDPRPWCYTTDPAKEWDYCFIPRCTSEPPTIVPELTCATGNGGMYRGRIAVTESGKTCQSWSAQTPHRHDKTPENYPCKGLDNNYCRNPDNWPMPWCYTTDPETRWEHCRVPSCDTASKLPAIVPELTCATGKGQMYRGRIAVTESGKTCQSWSAQTPHRHDKTPENYPHKGLDNNYCRNPDNEQMPWCYTTDPETRWEYCKVPNCDTEDCMHCNGEDYRGSISITENGFICQRWDSQEPHNHDALRTYPDKNLVENFCRNPRGDPRPWCYTTDPAKEWDYCFIPRCNLLLQPIISVSSSMDGVSEAQQQGFQVLRGSSFTISCSVQPQYPGGSFQLTFTSSNSAHNYTQPAVNHSAYFLFPEAEPAHQGNYSCVYHLYVFSHNFSSESRLLSVTVSAPDSSPVVIRAVVLLLILLLENMVLYFYCKASRGQKVDRRENTELDYYNLGVAA